MLVNGSQAKFLFNAAREGHWAIGAFNIMDYITGEVVISAAEELDVHLFGGSLPSSGLEDLRDLSAVRTYESAHVLDESDDRDLGLGSESDGLPAVEKGDLLRRGDDDHSVSLRDQLYDRQRLIPGSGRHVDYQVVEFSPPDIFDELLDRRHLDGSTPHNRHILAGKQECHGHYL